MASLASPAEMRDYIVERLVGEIGEPGPVMDAAKAMAERSLPAIQKAFGEVLSANSAMDVVKVELARFADAKSLAEGHCVMGVAASEASPDALLIILDAQCVAMAVSSLFGADLELPCAPLDRPPSATEVEVCSLLFSAAAAAINGSGKRSLSLKLPLSRPLSGDGLRKHVVRDGPAVRIDFSFGASETKGRITLLMPQRVLLNARRVAANGQEATDTKWTERFGAEIKRSSVVLEATMPLGRMTLGQVSTLVAGQIIEFPENAQSQAKLAARDKTLFVCEFGKLGQNYTVRVSHAFDARQDLLDGLASS